MKMSVVRWLGIRWQLFRLFPWFVGQPSQQISEWFNIFSGILFGPVTDFGPGVDLGSLLPDEISTFV
jgi:hypothetical protein